MKIFLIAGEPSGDKLGGALMSGLKAEAGNVSFEGIGGPLMQEQGLDSLFDMQELSLMGIAEILPKYRHLKRRIRETADAVLRARPDVLITIDSPDFCLRVARLVKAGSNIRTVHYVAPTVWAWRAGRAAKMARYIDQVLALLPFEPPFMEAAGMTCDFVGHPVAATRPISTAEKASFQSAQGLDTGRPAIVVLPGSRRSEIERLSHTFVQALNASAHADCQIILPTLPHLGERVADLFNGLNTPPKIADGKALSAQDGARQRLVAMACGDVALAASGTVSLELAATDTPMVIAYDMNWISRQIMSRMLLTDTVTLVNLVSESRTVPEFLGADCKPEAIARALSDLRSDPKEQRLALTTTMMRLGRDGPEPGLRAARAVLDRL